MEHDAWFFIGVFVFIFLVWISVGGPLHPIAFTGSRLSLPGALGGGTYLQLPRAPFTVGDSNVSLPGSSGSGSYNLGGSNSGGGVYLEGGSYSPTSAYQNVISMTGSVSNASSSNPATEYVQISLAQNASGPVKITGWTLESGATYEAELIPKGTSVPSSGVVNATEDIVLQPGQRAIIISGKSPVGASFRENKCIGYFSSFQQFSPSLPQNCPDASDEMSAYYGTSYIHDPSCIDYVATVPRCSVPFANTSKLSNTCQNFLDSHLNYNGCVSFHKADSDFNGNTWRIYLGRDTKMWRARHEIVKLLDDRGKTITSFTY